MEKAVINIKRTLVVLFLGLSKGVFSQGIAPLERVISIELNGVSTREALKQIEEHGQVLFAYKTDNVAGTNTIQRGYASQTVREILNDLFQGTMTYKERGNYIILKPAPKPAAEEVTLEGYILNAQTLEKLPYVSVYDTLSLTSTISDVYGYYKIRLSTKDDIVMRIRRDGFQDTIFRWTGEMPNVFSIALKPNTPVVAVDTAQTELPFFQRLKGASFLNVSEEQRANLINFKDKLKGKAQFSVVPGVGTNGKLSGVTTVDYSFNLLGGFNGGVRVLEIGGLFNMIWDTASYCQIAGLFNSVGGPVKGVQVAGLFNRDGSSVQGVQIGGLLNTARHINGVQLAGLLNQCGDSSRYVQASGLVNHAGRNYTGVQLAGLVNNTEMNGRGVQVSGLVNRAGTDFRGVQLSGLINKAATMKGVQLGVININDSIDGIALGFLSFSRKGLHQLEISADETFPANLGFRTGTHRFYNTLTVGGRFTEGNRPIWRFGYGVGTSVRTSPKSRLYFDLTSNLIYQNDDFQFNRALNTFGISYEYRLADKIALAVGPTFNALIDHQISTGDPNALSTIAPYSIYEDVWSDSRVISWVGVKVALRFF